MMSYTRLRNVVVIAIKPNKEYIGGTRLYVDMQNAKCLQHVKSAVTLHISSAVTFHILHCLYFSSVLGTDSKDHL